jgi:hypothetical protein
VQRRRQQRGDCRELEQCKRGGGGAAAGCAHWVCAASQPAAAAAAAAGASASVRSHRFARVCCVLWRQPLRVVVQQQVAAPCMPLRHTSASFCVFFLTLIPVYNALTRRLPPFCSSFRNECGGNLSNPKPLSKELSSPPPPPPRYLQFASKTRCSPRVTRHRLRRRPPLHTLIFCNT